MNVIPPITISDARLTSSTAAEPGPGETAWSATTLYAEGQQVYLGAPSATVTISNASPAVISWTTNNLAEGTPIVFSTTSALPAGLTAGTTYYLKRRLTVDTFTVSASLGGAAINTTSAGSGTQTATASVHRIFEALIGQAATVTMTIASPCVVTYTAHGLAAATPIVFTNSGGALPTGITAGTIYYVLSPTNDTFNVAATAGGSAINTSGSQSGTHTCGLASTYNKPPLLNDDVWGDIGPTNKWAMFDALRNTQTTMASPLTVVITPGVRVDSLALLGLDADSVTVTVTSSAVEVYSATQSLVTRDTLGWYDYFTGTFKYQPSWVAFDLPPYINAIITVTLTRSGGNVSCGALVLGIYQNIGTVLERADDDIQNYSTVTRDAFGFATMVQRRNIPKTNQTLLADKTALNAIRNLRDALNATPAVWSGLDDDSDDDSFETLLILGFYRRFAISLEGPMHALITLELEEI